MMNIGTLLEAADYIERKDREAEHGYASTLPMPVNYQRRLKDRQKARKQDLSRRRQNSICNKVNRSSHNELEKNRRAQLRHCLDRLKEMVPVGMNSSKHTTLGLLTKAKHFIKVLEAREKSKYATIEQLTKRRTTLRNRLAVLEKGRWRQSGDRSLSESSGTSSSSSLTSATSESDEVDVTGYDTESVVCGLLSDSDSDSLGGLTSDTASSCDGGGASASFNTGLLSLNRPSRYSPGGGGGGGGVASRSVTRHSARRASILRKQLMKHQQRYSAL